MTLTLEVPNDVLDMLKERAHKDGLEIEAYVVNRLKRDVTVDIQPGFDPDEPVESWSKRLRSGGFRLPDGVVVSEAVYDRDTPYAD